MTVTKNTKKEKKKKETDKIMGIQFCVDSFKIVKQNKVHRVTHLFLNFCLFSL